MNKRCSTTLIHWKTRNTKRAKRAREWCRNYGCAPINSALFIGNIYEKERARLQKEFDILFRGRTEKYYFFTLCASCSAGMTKEIRDMYDTKTMSFELVQFAEKSSKY